MAKNKKRYIITNVAEEVFKKEYEFSEREFKFLDKLFKDMNESSSYCYAGDLYIEEVKEN